MAIGLSYTKVEFILEFMLQCGWSIDKFLSLLFVGAEICENFADLGRLDDFVLKHRD